MNKKVGTKMKTHVRQKTVQSTTHTKLDRIPATPESHLELLKTSFYIFN